MNLFSQMLFSIIFCDESDSFDVVVDFFGQGVILSSNKIFSQTNTDQKTEINLLYSFWFV